MEWEWNILLKKMKKKSFLPIWNVLFYWEYIALFSDINMNYLNSASMRSREFLKTTTFPII